MELQKTKHQMQPKNGNMCLLHLYINYKLEKSLHLRLSIGL